ncbi:glycosyltransferase family 2 protein [Limosilactobacillus pontis]|uniref:Glycosyltransferase family 2 protein n=1 Tax=Limosilactobacillus pontis TaxID=35787 RepID=A0ABT7UZV8_9LACO|nr:glycosyltransferase family 2 protein [Limosilactobacillus pontis]MDM8267238.1 glycosyltransferase family 2 protein [Limosilactobacillus pontis]
MDKYSIDIIVPVYNAEVTLDKCITSLMKQKFTDFRVLLIDDGSTDSSGSMCDKYSQKYKNVITYHTKNKGRAAARNYGLDKANSKYLMFVDSDDWVDDQFCYKPFKYISKYDYDVVMFGYKINSETEKKVELPIVQEFKRVNNQEAFRLLINDDIGNFSWNKIFKRKLFSNIRYPVGHVFEDTATIYRIINKAEKIGILNEYLYHYRQRPDSVMHNLSVTTILDSIIARKQFHSFINENYPELSNISYNKLVFNYLQYAVYVYREINSKYDLKETSDFLNDVNMSNLKLNKKAVIMLYLFRNHLFLFKLISRLTR